jgi:hypothetical protein
MYSTMRILKNAWLDMLEPPWRHSGPDDERGWHTARWLIGWGWALAGVALGALVTPSLAQFAGLADMPYQDELVIGGAALAGFVVQLIGWCLLALMFIWVRNSADNGNSIVARMPFWLFIALFVTLVALPFAGVAYALSRYLTLVGAGQRAVTVAFVGGLLVKTFLIPFIKGIVTGAGFRVFMRWLRGKDSKAPDTFT